LWSLIQYSTVQYDDRTGILYRYNSFRYQPLNLHDIKNRRFWKYWLIKDVYVIPCNILRIKRTSCDITSKKCFSLSILLCYCIILEGEMHLIQQYCTAKKLSIVTLTFHSWGLYSFSLPILYCIKQKLVNTSGSSFPLTFSTPTAPPNCKALLLTKVMFVYGKTWI